ncbi:MAG TPA: caspase family protein [Polyangia bacterium]|nr:caspase family protein [Polyangia bacterium]
MRFLSILPVVLLLASARPTLAADPGDSPSLRRFALVASSNNGGPSRAHLRFANSDAESLARVLASLGGVHARDVLVIREASRAALLDGFEQVKGRIAAERRPQVRRELFVYYSGHSDGEGLLLGGERVGYKELREWIDQTAAEVRIAVLDSCASGALIRLKGGVRRQAFLSDASTQARGHAFLTASSADEAAQESDGIGAAFFTHYLLSGMRGAADSNRDGRVTLNEAYQFAYSETLQRTETSRAGAQHPAYDIQLAGTGDLVITDLHSSNARLVLGRELYGRIYVRDTSGHLLVELRKEPSYPVELGLEPGTYHVVMDSDGRIFESKAELSDGGRIELGKAQFHAVVPMLSTRRGDEVAPAAQPPLGPNLPVPSRYKDVAFDLVLAPGVRLSGASELPVRHHFVLGVVGHSDSLHGLQLSLAGNIAQYEMVGAQLGGFYQLSYGPARGAQLTYGVNMALGGLRGAQLASIANVSNGELRGVQGALINVNRGSLVGLEAGLANFNSGDVRGLEAGLLNIVKGDLHGEQAGLLNVVKGEVHGLQAGLVNITGMAAQSSGAQIGLANANGTVGAYSGAMVGLVNVGRNIHGAQVGLVNIADEVDGVQLGLANFAVKNRGVSLGLVPVVLDGYHRGAAWFSDASALNLGAKLGTRHVYVVLAAGMTRDRADNGNREFSCTFGIGGHFTPWRRPFFLDVDVSNTTFSDGDGRDEHRQISSLRLQAGWQFARYFAVVAGPTLNVQVAPDAEDRAPRGIGFAEGVWHSRGHTVRMYPGLVAGLQF